MNALLLYPEVPDTFWSFKYILKFVRKKSAHPPLGLLTIAALMPKEWQCKVVDLNVEGLTDEHLKWADMVFISAMLVHKKSVTEIITRCNKFDKTVVAGGPLFSTGENAKEAWPGIDHLVQDEGEITFPRFLSDLAKGKPEQIYTSEEKPDITKTPLPRWDLINLKHYASLSVQYSRGCPFNCEFCDVVRLNGRRPRLKTNDQMVEELDVLYQGGYRGMVFIVDDNFIGNKIRVKSLLKTLILWQKAYRYPFTFYTEASVDLAKDEELLTLMSTAGFDSVFLGLETPDEASLRECGKHQNRNINLVDAVKIIQQHGLEVMGGFILGFDNDQPSIFERQINFIESSGVARAMIGLLHALPGTRLYERLSKEGRLLLGATGDNCDGSLNFVPKMDAKILHDGYQLVMNYLYSPKQYYKRVLEFLKTYEPHRKRGVSWNYFLAFIRSLFYMGMLEKGKSKIYYWIFLLKAFFLHRRKFSEAVSSAIFGYHLRKILTKVEGFDYRLNTKKIKSRLDRIKDLYLLESKKRLLDVKEGRT